MGRDVSLPQPTVHRHLNLLEISHLSVRLPAYAVNRTKRLIKSPKRYWGDTGVALYLAEAAEPGGCPLMFGPTANFGHKCMHWILRLAGRPTSPERDGPAAASTTPRASESSTRAKRARR